MNKKLLAFTLAAFAASPSFAGLTTPADVRWTQNLDVDPANGTITRYLSIPASGVTCAAILSGTTRQPACYTIGSGLSISGTTITADGVSPASLTTTLANYATTAVLSSGLSGKMDVPSGTTAQYLRGDGTVANFPVTGIADVTGLQAALDGKQAALGFTPYNAANPAGYITSAALTPYATTASLSGYVTSSALTALGYVTPAGARSAISLTTTGSGAATYNATTGVLNVPTPAATAARSFASPVRSLNTAFQISASRDAQVVYTVDISVTSLLLAGASGRVYLEYADDAGFTSNVVTVSSSPNATGGVLNVTNLGSGNVTGMIPAGKYARIRTQNVSSTPTFTFQSSQEVLL